MSVSAASSPKALAEAPAPALTGELDSDLAELLMMGGDMGDSPGAADGGDAAVDVKAEIVESPAKKLRTDSQGCCALVGLQENVKPEEADAAASTPVKGTPGNRAAKGGAPEASG